MNGKYYLFWFHFQSLESLNFPRPVEGDELRGLLDQRPSDVGHTAGHGGLADADGVAHGGLEGARGVEAKRSQDLHLGADGARPLRAAAQNLWKTGVQIIHFHYYIYILGVWIPHVKDDTIRV